MITIMGAISDKKASNIFKSIASSELNSDILITQLKLTRKQYYSRTSYLIKAGLVKRQKGRFLLTSFGKVIYSAQLNLEAKIESALTNYWKLKAIDSIESSSDDLNNIISALIDDQEIKSALMKEEESARRCVQAAIDKKKEALARSLIKNINRSKLDQKQTQSNDFDGKISQPDLV
jgi:predicted transcriptional regulator